MELFSFLIGILFGIIGCFVLAACFAPPPKKEKDPQFL